MGEDVEIIPQIDRFLTRDTYTGDITDPRSLNLYSYLYNNLAYYNDPSGHFPFPLIFAGWIIYDFFRTFSDPCSTNFDKGVALASLIPGIGPDPKAEKSFEFGTDVIKKSDHFLEMDLQFYLLRVRLILTKI